MVNSFQITDGNAEIIKKGYRTYLQVNDISKKIVVESNNLVSLIYVNGVKFYQEKSRFFDLLDLEGDDYDINNLSESLELSKLNVANIIGNSQYYFSNILAKVQDEMVEITGNILMNDNVVINYGNIYEDYLYGSIIEQNEELIQGELNLKTNFPSIYLNDQLFYLLEYEKIDDNFRITVPCLYQEIFDERGPNFNSRIVNLQVIVDEKSNIISKKLWNSYGIITNEIFVDKGIIYPLIITIYDPLGENKKIINLNGTKYNYKIGVTYLNFKEINNIFLKKNDEDIFIDIRKDDKYISQIIHKKKDYEIAINEKNILDEINRTDNNLPNNFFDIPIWNKKWEELDNKIKSNLEILGWDLSNFNEYVENKTGKIADTFFQKSWNDFNAKELEAMKSFGYNLYNWNLRFYTFKKILFVEEDLLILDKTINLSNILLVVGPNVNLIIGKNSILNVEYLGILFNKGNIVVQDNGILNNEFLILNPNFSNIIVTSNSAKNTAILNNKYIITNDIYGKIFITGYGVMDNQYYINKQTQIYWFHNN